MTPTTLRADRILSAHAFVCADASAAIKVGIYKHGTTPAMPSFSIDDAEAIVANIDGTGPPLARTARGTRRGSTALCAPVAFERVDDARGVPVAHLTLRTADGEDVTLELNALSELALRDRLAEALIEAREYYPQAA